MKDVQYNKLMMFLAVQKSCNTSNIDWSANPAFANAFSSFETSLAKLKRSEETQKMPITGIAKDKSEIRNALIDKAVEVAGVIAYYASITGNETLHTKVDFVRSSFQRMRGASVISLSQNILDTAAGVAAEAGNYGSSAESRAELQSLINEFSDALVTPRAAISHRVLATKEIEKNISETDEILGRQLDKLIETFKKVKPEFYNSYQEARKIIDLGHRFELKPTDPLKKKDEPPSGKAA